MKSLLSLLTLTLLLSAVALPATYAQDAMQEGAMKDGAMKDGAMKGDAMKSSTKKGGFTSVDAPTTGTATFVKEGNKTYLQLSKDFTIGEAPAIRVTLYRAAVPPKKTYVAAQYLDLGALTSKKGAQRYLIPTGTNLNDFKAVAIWCKKFDVTLAYMTITP